MPGSAPLGAGERMPRGGWRPCRSVPDPRPRRPLGGSPAQRARCPAGPQAWCCSLRVSVGGGRGGGQGGKCSHLVQLRRTWRKQGRLRGCRVARRDGAQRVSPRKPAEDVGPPSSTCPALPGGSSRPSGMPARGRAGRPVAQGQGHQEVQASGPPSVVPARSLPHRRPLWPWCWRPRQLPLGPVPASDLFCEPSPRRARAGLRAAWGGLLLASHGPCCLAWPRAGVGGAAGVSKPCFLPGAPGAAGAGTAAGASSGQVRQARQPRPLPLWRLRVRAAPGLLPSCWERRPSVAAGTESSVPKAGGPVLKPLPHRPGPQRLVSGCHVL